MSDLTLALLEFQKAAPVLERDAVNPHFRSKFASLEKVVETVRPRLNDHGLVLLQFPTVMADGSAGLRTVIVHAESGESVEDVMLLQTQKHDPQAQGAALTYARRYAIASILGLVADEDAELKQPRRQRRSAGEPEAGFDGSPNGGDAGLDASEASSPAESPFKAPTGQRGRGPSADALADELVDLVQELGATDSLPTIETKREAGDVQWLKRQVATAKKHLASKAAA